MKCFQSETDTKRLIQQRHTLRRASLVTRSETDRFIINGDASRRKGCEPTRTSVITILVVYPFKKKPTYLIGS